MAGIHSRTLGVEPLTDQFVKLKSGAESRLRVMDRTHATEPTPLNIKRVRDWTRTSLSAAAGAADGDSSGEITDTPSEPGGFGLGLGEANGSLFFGGSSQKKEKKENELITLEAPPFTYKPKRWRKRPRRCYGFASSFSV